MTPITHGTDYGYQMHRARGEQACRDCLDAHAEALAAAWAHIKEHS